MDTKGVLVLAAMSFVLGCEHGAESMSDAAVDGLLDAGIPDTTTDVALDQSPDVTSDSADSAVDTPHHDAGDASANPFAVLVPAALGVVEDFLMTEAFLYVVIRQSGMTHFWVCPPDGCSGSEVSVLSPTASTEGNAVAVHQTRTLWRRGSDVILSDLDGANAASWMDLGARGQTLEGLYADDQAIWVPRIENPGTPSAISIIGVFGTPLSPPEELSRGGLMTRFAYSSLYSVYSFDTPRSGSEAGTIYVANRIVSSEVPRAVAPNLTQLLICGSSLLFSTSNGDRRQLFRADLNTTSPPTDFFTVTGSVDANNTATTMACDATQFYINRASTVQSCPLQSVATGNCEWTEVVSGIPSLERIQVAARGLLINSRELGLLQLLGP